VHCYRSQGENQKALIDFRNGDLQMLCSVDMISRGFDMPQAEICLLCCPTNSLIVLVQTIGRMLRIFPGKEKCIILDQGNSTEDIVSKYLELPSGFSPYDPINLSEENLLEIVEPPLPKKIEEKLGGGGGFGRAGVLGEAHKKLSYCEQRAHTFVEYAKEHRWNDKQLVEKFISNCTYPSLSSVEILANYLKAGSEQKDIDRYADIVYNCCLVYSSVRLGRDIPQKVQDKLTPFQIQKVSRKARARRNTDIRGNQDLKEKSIVADFAPPNNSYYHQLQIAALKGGNYEAIFALLFSLPFCVFSLRITWGLIFDFFGQYVKSYGCPESSLSLFTCDTVFVKIVLFSSNSFDTAVRAPVTVESGEPKAAETCLNLVLPRHTNCSFTSLPS
jgi:hypothetical protein